MHLLSFVVNNILQSPTVNYIIGGVFVMNQAFMRSPQLQNLSLRVGTRQS